MHTSKPLKQVLLFRAIFRGFDLKDKIIGIVGTGRIGANMIKDGQRFQYECDCLPTPFPKQNLDQELGFRYVSFEELLHDSDIISLHAPLNEHTRYMINKNNINQMKRGVFFINTARGGLIETSALEQASRIRDYCRRGSGCIGRRKGYV